MLRLKDLDIDPSSNAHSRRSLLIEAMASLEGKEIHCFQCSGTCCTSVANSMQITPLETLEIIEGLIGANADLKEVELKLKVTIEQYRLDYELSTGKKGIKQLRRTYTCPFYSPGPKGCALSRSIKPYGCLAFNPKMTGDNGSTCSSMIELLETRERDHQSFEDIANQKIREAYQIDWEKLDLPRALLTFFQKLKINA